MQDERTSPAEFDTEAEIGQDSESAPRTRPGLRASILAGLTIGAATVIAIGSDLSTVVSHGGAPS